MQRQAEVDIFLTDLNGILRGKRLPLVLLEKVLKEGYKMPRSVLGVDIWGDDVAANGLVFETGDSDGICLPLPQTLSPIPWLDGKHQQMLVTMFNPDGSPFGADPRQILQAVLQRYAKHGLTPVVAVELEFYLFDASSTHQEYPTLSPLMPRSHASQPPDSYAMHDLDNFRALLGDIRSACDLQGIVTGPVIAEFGEGQFEMNLAHEADALAAADHAILFKRTVKAIAQQHQHLASFMPKPFGDKSGSGFHLHFSLLDAAGNNVFDNGTPQGSEKLTQAVAGILSAMQDSMLIFAPSLNAYRRLLPDSLAPVALNWGYENRTVAVRIPDSPNEARRIEHRVAGADANPYLVLAAILAAALHGIEQQLTPPPAYHGDTAQDTTTQRLPSQWLEAIQVFENSGLMRELLGDEFARVFTAIKRQEFAKFARRVSDAEYQTYLGVL